MPGAGQAQAGPSEIQLLTFCPRRDQSKASGLACFWKTSQLAGPVVPLAQGLSVLGSGCHAWLWSHSPHLPSPLAVLAVAPESHGLAKPEGQDLPTLGQLSRVSDGSASQHNLDVHKASE